MAEEQTVLEIANGTQRLLNSLEGSVDRALRRGEGTGQCITERPLNPSVVGEIIELMHENNKRLADLSEQIRLEVLIKLDRPDKPDTGKPS